MEIIKWIENWYVSQCDGDWEHSYGIIIETIDNPGWSITIDLLETSIEKLFIEYSLTELSENNWYGYSVNQGQFKAVGDPTKLFFLLNLFKKIVETNSI
ncbi:immunity 53 family protein [Bergeyella zoohelcum]|uniref:Immunity protein 53 n=1 Tax=Bergeyella zoohelcum TaxID=1015 RepID=A0A380ZV18_9FLAO|nr:immunity 53 family protein [Bergeyella zoohelcum]EKB58756.1 hypothetical protein HMPREF9700_01795 [Bergeyella zoohelcum CCUG 30536]SUV53201.1 Uncharacterised protein [Bergeyella zoohelcum]